MLGLCRNHDIFLIFSVILSSITVFHQTLVCFLKIFPQQTLAQTQKR